MVQVLVALEASAHRRLARSNRGASCYAVTPPTRTASPPAVPSLIWPSVVRACAVATAASPHTAASNWTRPVSMVTAAAGPSHARDGATARHKRRESAWRHGESRDRHHAVHAKSVEVESTGCACRGLSTRLREMTVGICIGPRRCDMRRVHDVGVDELKLYAGTR